MALLSSHRCQDSSQTNPGQFANINDTKTTSDFESKGVSLERVLQYAALPPEPAMHASVGGAKGTSKNARDKAIFGSNA